MDQTGAVANTETWVGERLKFFRTRHVDARRSLIDSANEFAYLIQNQQQ
jgi:hypothetical protein